MAEIRDYLTGVIVFMLVLMSVNFIVGIVLNTVGVSPSSSDYDVFMRYNDTTNKYNELNSSMTELEQSITNSSGLLRNMPVFGPIESFINSGFLTFTSIFTSIGWMNTIFSSVALMFGIPPWITGFITLLLIVLFVFSIYSAVFQRRV